MKAFIILPTSLIPYLHPHCLLNTVLFCPLFPTQCCTFEGYVLTHGLACWEQPFGKCGLIFIMTAFIISINCTIILVGKIPRLVKNVTFLFQKCCYNPCSPKSSRVNDSLGSSFWRARTVKRGRGGVGHTATLWCRSKVWKWMEPAYICCSELKSKS